MGVLSRLAFWNRKDKENVQALPEGTGKEMNVTRNSHKDFVKSMIFKDTPKENSSDLADIIYDPKGFEKVLNLRDWYLTADLRNEYYSYSKRELSDGEKPTYKGALVLRKYSSKSDVTVIDCLCIDSETRKIKEVELGRINGPYEETMQVMDSIISLQMKNPYKDEGLRIGIQKHVERLERTKGLELSVLGEKILSYTGKDKLIIEDMPYEELYEKRVNFKNLETKKALVQLPYICMQADIEGQTPESIDKIVEAFIEYSKLAIDIGCIDKWKEIDQMNEELRNYGFLGHNLPGVVKYSRKPTYKEESYAKIKDKFLDQKQANIIDKIEDKEVQGGFISQKDIQENFIHRVTGKNMANLEFIVKTDMEDLSVKLGTYIGKYKEMHKEDSKYDDKINLLNDMVVYSQVIILEAVRGNNRKPEVQEEINQEDELEQD